MSFFARTICFFVITLFWFPQLSEAIGNIKLGRVAIHPGFGIKGRFNSNLFLEADNSFANGTSESRSEDFSWVQSPLLNIEKTRERGELFGFQVNYIGSDEHFFELTDQNYFEHDLQGQLEFSGPGNRTQLLIKGRIFDTLRQTTNEFATNLDPRAQRLLTRVDGELTHSVTPLSKLSASLGYRSNKFDNITSQGEDQNNFLAGASFFWKFLKLTAMGLKYDFQSIEYTSPFTINTDSQTNTTAFAVRWDPTALISGEASVGFTHRSFDDGLNQNTIQYQMDLEYELTKRSIFKLKGQRNVIDSTFSNVDAFILTSVDLTWSHEWNSKVESNIGIGYQNRDFGEDAEDVIGGGGLKKRNDDQVTLGINVAYKIQEWLQASADYKYNNTTSNFKDTEFDLNLASLALTIIF
jgi:hypothetical protein